MGDNATPIDWDVFWTGSDEIGAPGAGCTSDSELLDKHWRAFFQSETACRASPVIFDLACGAGAVFRGAKAEIPQSAILVCLDYSLSAVKSAVTSPPATYGVVSNCTSLPIKRKSVDILVSQFGIEYAGFNAMRQAGELLTNNGVLCFLTHYRDGAIYKECEANAKSAASIYETGVLAAAKSSFAACAQFDQGKLSQAQLSREQRVLATAVSKLETSIQASGTDAAGGLLAQLYDSLGQMFRRRTAFDPKDLLDWCDRFNAETASYIKRMTAMMNAALDDSAIERLKHGYGEVGLQFDQDNTQMIKSSNDIIAAKLVFRRT